jgi:hypothetical protein
MTSQVHSLLVPQISWPSGFTSPNTCRVAELSEPPFCGCMTIVDQHQRVSNPMQAEPSPKVAYRSVSPHTPTHEQRSHSHIDGTLLVRRRGRLGLCIGDDVQVQVEPRRHQAGRLDQRQLCLGQDSRCLGFDLSERGHRLRGCLRRRLWSKFMHQNFLLPLREGLLRLPTVALTA